MDKLIKIYETAPRWDKLNYMKSNWYTFKNIDGLRKKIQILRGNKKEKRTNNILVVWDLHSPAIKEWYLEFLIKTYKKYSCKEVIFIWDIIDNHYSSFHPSDPNWLWWGNELKNAIDLLQPFYRAFPKAKVCLWNHDEIVRRQAFANWIPREWIKEYSDVLWTPLWKFDFEFEIDWVIYNHWLSWWWQRGAIKEAIMRWKSVVRGHYHSQCYVDWYADKTKKIFWMQVWAWCDDNSYALAYWKYSLHKSVIWCWIVFWGKDAKVELMNL